MSVQYQPAVIAEFAEKLYAQAGRLVVAWALRLGLAGLAIGGFAGATLGKGAMGFAALAGALLGALFGASYGRERAFALRLQAQQALCQLQTEQNTRRT